MDKYEFNIKVDQIKKLAAKKSFQEAAAIAKEMNWQKVKDWSTLATVINVQEAAGDYLEARDMAILAYNRNLGWFISWRSCSLSWKILKRQRNFMKNMKRCHRMMSIVFFCILI